VSDGGGEQNRTEEATPFKLRRAREKGQVARGLDLGFVAGLVGLAAFASIAGVGLMAQLSLAMRRALVVGVREAADPGAAMALAARSLWPVLQPVVLFGGTVVAVVLLVEVVQLRGLMFSAAPLKPDFNRLNPAAGLKRLFSRRMLMESAKSVLKTAVYAVVAVVTIRASLRGATQRIGDASHLADVLRSAGMRLLLVFVLVAIFFAALDQLLARRAFARQMRMSRREVTREVKDREGDARLKGRRKQLHASLVEQAKGEGSVRGADLLVVNPQHVAVALSYYPDKDRAPRVVAKGAEHHALRLRRAAVRWNVPILHQPALARALFAEAERGRPIPAAHYNPVAELYLKLEADRRA